MEAKSSMARSAGSLLKEALSNFKKDDGLRMSAALSYYSAFSLAPLILIAVSIAGAFFGEDAVRGALSGELSRDIGPAGALVIQDMVAHARRPADNFMMSVAGTVLLLIGAAGVFGQLQKALNTIWNTDAPPVSGLRAFVRTYLSSFSMVLVTGFLMLISMILSTALQAVSANLQRMADIPLAAWIAGSGALSFAVTYGLFCAMFKILPNAPIKWRDVWVGALFTTGLFMVGKLAIAWYLGREATSSSYGSAGSFVVLLMWLYYSSIILLFGAEFTASYSRMRASIDESSL
jgi:membrane protein